MDVIRIESRCNQNCIFCGADPGNVGDYTADLRELALRMQRAPQDAIIEVSGGEPTLSPLLPKVLMLAKRLGRRISLQTNATRFASRRFTQVMVKAGLTHAFVSLHAADAATSDAITRMRGGFDLTVAGVESLRREGVHVSLNFVICRENVAGMSDYVRFVAARFGRGLPVVFSFINPFYRAWEEPGRIPRISEIREALHAALREGEALGLEMHVPDICGIPLCFLAGVERFADKLDTIARRLPFSPHPQKVKAVRCRECVWDAECDGLWERYADRYGADEIIPVRERPAVTARGGQNAAGEGTPSEGPIRDTALLVGVSCPNDCIFCNEGGACATRRAMSLGEAATLLEATKPDWVFLSGGEPTTCPNLSDYVRLARQHGAERVTLVSNGSGLADEVFARGLLEAGLSEIRLSIHGHDAALHDAQTRRAGSFAAIEQAVRNLQAWRADFAFTTIGLVVVNSLNLDALEAIVLRLIEWRFDKIGLGIVEPTRSAQAAFDRVVPRYAAVARALENLMASLGSRLAAANISLVADNLPPCLLHADDVPLGRRSVIQTVDHAEGGVLEMSPHREKIYGPPCLACPQRGVCEGVFEAYIARFGWDEFGASRP